MKDLIEEALVGEGVVFLMVVKLFYPDRKAQRKECSFFYICFERQRENEGVTTAHQEGQ